MVAPHSLHRPSKGQSPKETSAAQSHAGRSKWRGAIMVIMLLTVFIAGALIGSVHAHEASPRATAVAVARAEIMSGVRITREMMMPEAEKPSRTNRMPKPRERPCPDHDAYPCRMIVIDLP